MTAKLDASALIYLNKAGLLDLAVRVCDELVITQAVYDECVVRGRRAGHRDAEAIQEVINVGTLRVVSLNESGQQRLTAANFDRRLGRGEQETIIEALEKDCLTVLDDIRARSAAAVLGANLSRTETLVLEALVRGLVGPVDFEKHLLRLAQVRGMRADELSELLRIGHLIIEVMSHDRANDRPEGFTD